MEGLREIVQVVILGVGILSAMDLRRHVDFDIDVPWLPFLSNLCTMGVETHRHSSHLVVIFLLRELTWSGLQD